ncbi:MAG: phosphohistidine phosphatase SixA [Kiritimatiellae bacterium]|nr:phosphohistidine phosphatase SixA [Kiritimatiellia bacterium]
MKLYLLRHGIAVDVGEEGVACDADRMLSAKGRKRTGKVVAGLARLGCQPERIVSSPLVRAAQTAQLAAEHLAPERGVSLCEGLAPGAPLAPLLAWLEKQTENALMLVGHMPDLADLAAVLLVRGAGPAMTFKKAGVCCLSFPDRVRAGEGCLEWLIQPKLLRLC